jgi:pimeloyl-ACP methyl ester carboxylesterase
MPRGHLQFRAVSAEGGKMPKSVDENHRAQSAMTQSQYITVNGLRLHYLEHGDRAKPPLICLHGLSGNAHSFDGLAARLTEYRRVIVLDVRGRGDSGWGPPGDYNTTVYTNDLAGLIDALGLSRVALIGTSMGGAIAMMYAGGYPDRVERLVLNDIGPEVDPAGAARITAYMIAAPVNFATLTDVAAYYRDNYPALRETPQNELLEFVKWSVRPAAGGGYEWKLDPAVRNIPRSGTAARLMDMWVPYARISAPVLAVRGAESDILSRATTTRMRTVQRRTTVVEIPGVGHAPSLLEPEALTAIKEFLAT